MPRKTRRAESPRLQRIVPACPECGSGTQASGALRQGPAGSPGWTVEFLCAQDDEIFPFWSAASAQVTHCTTDQAAHGATDLPLPGCATIDDRPARKLAAPVGGLVIEAFDLRTGLLEAEPVCPPPCPGHPGDGEAADAPAFEQRLVSLRHDLAEGA